MIDAHSFQTPDELLHAAKELASTGVTLLQYRNKIDDARTILDEARELRSLVRSIDRSHLIRLIMNDRADLCLAAEFDGVHVGQTDLAAESVRKIIGPSGYLGVSTHNPEQVREADRGPADYVAVGPVFATSTKTNPDPVVGLAGVRQARALTAKTLVAIGGITRENCRAVIDAGADLVAVISDLVREPRKSAEEFLRILG